MKYKKRMGAKVLESQQDDAVTYFLLGKKKIKSTDVHAQVQLLKSPPCPPLWSSLFVIVMHNFQVNVFTTALWWTETELLHSAGTDVWIQTAANQLVTAPHS